MCVVHGTSDGRWLVTPLAPTRPNGRGRVHWAPGTRPPTGEGAPGPAHGRPGTTVRLDAAK